MKRKIAGWVTWLYLLTAHAANAQMARDLQEGNADYAVPVPAALLALQNGSPVLMEPSSVRSMAVGARAAVTDYGSMASSFGAEVAPILLGGNLDLADYLRSRASRVWYRLRISLAAQQSSVGGLNSALGLRLMLHDDADPRADRSWQSAMVDLGSSVPSIAHIYQVDTMIGGNHIVRIDTLGLTAAVSNSRSLQTNIDSIRDLFMDRHWDLSVFDFGVAAVYHSDASSNQLRVRRYCGFFSIGCHYQLGVSGWLGYDELAPFYQHEATFALRTYVGENAVRGYIGVDMNVRANLAPDYRAELGAITRILNGLWLREFVDFSCFQRPLFGPKASLTLTFGTPAIQS